MKRQAKLQHKNSLKAIQEPKASEEPLAAQEQASNPIASKSVDNLLQVERKTQQLSQYGRLQDNAEGELCTRIKLLKSHD